MAGHKPNSKSDPTYERLVDTLESMTDGFVALDRDWRYTYVNRRAGEMLGRNAQELVGKHIWTEFPEGVGQDFYKIYHQVMEHGIPATIEEFYPPWKRWFENRIYPTREGLSIFFQEITDRKRSEQIIEGQRKIHEMIAVGKPLKETLFELTRMIESQEPEMTCTILLLDEDGIRLTHGAAPSLPQEITKAIDGSPIGPSAGSCGTAAFRGQKVFVQDIETDPLWQDYRHLFLPYGYRACWSTPIFDENNKVLGTFAMYYRQPGLPSNFHQRLINIATNLAAISITRNRSEEFLRRSRQQLALIYDTVSDVVFLLEVQAGGRFCFVSVNQAFLSATGLKAEQVTGKFVDEVIPREAHKLVFGNYDKAIREKRPVQWEESTTYPSGRKTAIVRVSPVFDDKGVCTNLVGAVHDVTEFREAEEEARKSGLELEHIYATAPAGLSLVDEDLRFLRINDELAAINGLSPEAHLGRTVLEVLPELAPKLKPIYQHVLHTGEPVVHQEIRGITPAHPGAERTWLANFYPVQANDGKTRAVSTVVMEITDRAAITELGLMALGDTDLEALYFAAYKRVEKTLNTEFFCMWEFVSDGNSLAPFATFGFKHPIPRTESGAIHQAEFTMQSRDSIIVNDMATEKRFAIPRYIREHGINRSISVIIPAKNEPYGVLGAFSSDHQDFSLDQVHFLKSIANILGTVIERKKLEQRIFQAHKLELIGGLAAGVAHQLNTPLSVIMMRLQMLREDLGPSAGDALVSQLDGILNSAKKMSAIIQDLLNFSRIPTLKKETVQIEALLVQIAAFVEVRARKQNVKILNDFCEQPNLVHADKNRLEQAFLNIIINAMDAMPEGGVLSIRTRPAEKDSAHFVSVEFEDSGFGMNPEEVSRIFDPFFTTKSQGQGTGLGLSVTYEIIKSHAGEIRVQSRKGKGSTFRVMLPLRSES